MLNEHTHIELAREHLYTHFCRGKLSSQKKCTCIDTDEMRALCCFCLLLAGLHSGRHARCRGLLVGAIAIDRMIITQGTHFASHLFPFLGNH